MSEYSGDTKAWFLSLQECSLVQPLKLADPGDPQSSPPEGLLGLRVRSAPWLPCPVASFLSLQTWQVSRPTAFLARTQLPDFQFCVSQCPLEFWGKPGWFMPCLLPATFFLPQTVRGAVSWRHHASKPLCFISKWFTLLHSY